MAGFAEAGHTEQHAHLANEIRNRSESSRWRASRLNSCQVLCLPSSCGAEGKRPHPCNQWLLIPFYLMTELGCSLTYLPSICTSLTSTTIIMAQKAATMSVMRVNKSPAREPNGLDPPTPPKAPARPPPLPRWMRIMPIRIRPDRMTTPFNTWIYHATPSKFTTALLSRAQNLPY